MQANRSLAWAAKPLLSRQAPRFLHTLIPTFNYLNFRDLITTPAEDLGPADLAAEASALAALHGARISVISGDDLLAAGYPAVHTVGRAAARPPALIDLNWAPPGAAAGAAEAAGAAGESAGDVGGKALPVVALVGKGVVFDSGGLDIKSATGMRLMKKVRASCS